MRRVLVVSMVVLIGAAGWRIGERLDSDAVSMAVGVFFGVLAGVPAAILVLAARRDRRDAEPPDAPPVRYDRPPYLPQPPVIVVTPSAYGAPLGPGQAAAPYANALPYDAVPPRKDRQFKIVGEEEAWIED